jgi:hypothetical protein
VSGARGHVEDVKTGTCGSAPTCAGHRAEQNRGARSRQADRAQVRVTRVNCSPGGRAPYSAAARLLEARKSPVPQFAAARHRVTRHTAGIAASLSTCHLWMAAVSCVATLLQPELPCDAGASQPCRRRDARRQMPPSVAARPTALATKPGAPAGRDRRPTDAAQAPVSLPRPR